MLFLHRFILAKYMRRSLSWVWIFVFLWLLTGLSVSAKEKRDVYGDSIMALVLDRAIMYQQYIRSYEANVYIKATSDVLKKNYLLRFTPDFFTVDKKNENILLEAMVELSYKSPNRFNQKIIALNGTTLNPDFIRNQAMQFLNVNIYNPTSFRNEVFMPVAKNAFNYYYFFHEKHIDTMDIVIHKIRVEPKLVSQKLVSGYLYIVDQTYHISKADMQGKSDFTSFHVITDYGIDFHDFLLPYKSELNLEFNILGNSVSNHYSSVYQYTEISKHDASDRQKILQNYDLTDHYRVEMDSLPIVTDSLYWSDCRPFPLSRAEQSMYNEKRVKEQTAIDSLNPLIETRKWNFAKGIISPTQFGYKSSDMRYSGLINPFKLAYSKMDGFVYWQQLKIRHETRESGREVTFDPSIGFVFGRKEVYGNLPVAWLYNPRHIGVFSIVAGNSNQTYSSKVVKEINKRLRGSKFSFEDLELQYYKHYFISLNNRNEIRNGLLLNFSLDYHFYDPVKKNTNMPPQLRLADDIAGLTTTNYSSISPGVSIIWTPGQYYRFTGRKKEYVGSNYPTLSVEYTRGIPDILGCNSRYERIEGDINQKILLGMSRSFQYYVGGGIFTNTASVYFADFRKCTRRNFPQSWDDKIGGIFQLLDRNWYNASNSYLQLHTMYESPLMLLSIFRRLTKDIAKERFYFSQLYTPALPSYTELGYGAGTFLFNVGAFVSFNKNKFESFGFKFAFEL